MLFRFNRNYFLLTILLFATEVAIAMFVHDRFIRPYFGDFLVVILIYCFLKSFIGTPQLQKNTNPPIVHRTPYIVNLKLALSVLAFAYLVEVLQYFHLADLPAFRNSR